MSANTRFLITNQLLYQLSYADADAVHITALRVRKQAVGRS